MSSIETNTLRRLAKHEEIQANREGFDPKECLTDGTYFFSKATNEYLIRSGERVEVWSQGEHNERYSAHKI